MPLQSYNNRMQVILDGKELKKNTAPRKNSKDPIVSFEDKVNKILLEYEKKGLLSDKLYHQFHKTGTQPPRLYGLSKNHKKDSPMRPVLSMCNSMYENLASKLAKWLSVIPDTSINCKTADISKSIKDVNLDCLDVLCLLIFLLCVQMYLGQKHSKKPRICYTLGILLNRQLEKDCF